MQGVAKNFRETFAELAPGGKGELVMLKATPPQQAPETEDGAPAQQAHPAFDRYSGVKVKVGSRVSQSWSSIHQFNLAYLHCLDVCLAWGQVASSLRFQI